VANGTPGGGVFVSEGGKLYLSAVLNEGLAAGGTVNSHADMLIVDSTRLGSAATTIFVSYDPDDLGGLTDGNGIQLVEVLDKTASDADVFVLGNMVAAGAYEYALHHNGVGDDAADGNWYLRSAKVTTPTPPGPPPADPDDDDGDDDDQSPPPPPVTQPEPPAPEYPV